MKEFGTVFFFAILQYEIAETAKMFFYVKKHLAYIYLILKYKCALKSVEKVYFE